MNGVLGSEDFSRFTLALPFCGAELSAAASLFFSLWDDSPGEDKETDIQPESAIRGRVLSAGMKRLVMFP